MQIYLPIAEMAVAAEAVFMLSMFVGFLSGVFGVGGGFLTTPFLLFSGIPPAVAVATPATQIVAASVSGVMGHMRNGHVDFKIGCVMLTGGIMGAFVGIGLFKLLIHFGQIDLIISLLYVVLLGTIGTLMFTESISTLLPRKKKKSPRHEFNTQKTPLFMTRLPYKMRFPRSKLYISVLVPGGVGFVGGVLTAILGVGGGFLLIPAMIYIIGMPAILVAGTSLFQIIFTAGASTVMHATLNGTVDFTLAMILILGVVIGTQIGVSAARLVQGKQARLILAVIVLLVCAQLAGQLFIQPHELYSTQVVK